MDKDKAQPAQAKLDDDDTQVYQTELIKLLMESYDKGVADALAETKTALAQLPQRTWVGLTDEDWKEIEDMPDTFDQGVAWCLARLKEKNT